MANHTNSNPDDETIQAIEQAWQKFQKEMDELKRKQLAILKKHKEESEKKELEKAKKEINN